MYEDFLKEKQYITNVSPRTLEWYNQALGWWDGDVKKTVIRMREAGLKPRSINSYRTAINSYLHWLSGSDKKCSPQCPHQTIPRMKDEQRVLPTFKPEDIQAILRWKPKNRCERRLHTLTLMLVDTGCRISELLGLRWS